MSWQTLIQPGPVWSGVTQYAEERIAELTAICVNAQTSPEQWRAAQAGIEEMRRLKTLPDQLKATADQKRNSATKRTGY
jgi:hypothetical protein